MSLPTAAAQAIRRAVSEVIGDKIGTAASESISGATTTDEALNNLQVWATDRMDRAGYYKK